MDIIIIPLFAIKIALLTLMLKTKNVLQPVNHLLTLMLKTKNVLQPLNGIFQHILFFNCMNQSNSLK